MAKRKLQKRQQEEEAVLTYKQMARARRERKQRRQILLGVGAVVVLVVIILIVAIIVELMIKPGEPVATVSGIEIRTDEFQERVRHERSIVINQYLQFADLFGIEQAYQFSGVSALYGFGETSLEDNYEEFGGQVLDTMIDEILIREASPDMGLKVLEDEVSTFIEEQYNYYRDGTPTPLPTSTPRPTATPITPTDTLPTPAPSLTPRPSPTVVTEDAYKELYQTQLDALKSIDVGESVLLGSVEMQLLTDKVKANLMEDMPETAEQVEYDAMFFSTAVEASVFMARLDSGETFEDLITELQTDPDSPGTAVSAPWATKDEVSTSLGEEAAELLFSLEMGVLSDVTATADGAVVTGGRLFGGEVDSLGDHRIAMAFAVLAAKIDSTLTIRNVANVATSFPGFVSVCSALGLRIRESANE
jgi:hypothetical protein